MLHGGVELDGIVVVLVAAPLLHGAVLDLEAHVIGVLPVSGEDRRTGDVPLPGVLEDGVVEDLGGAGLGLAGLQELLAVAVGEVVCKDAGEGAVVRDGDLTDHQLGVPVEGRRLGGPGGGVVQPVLLDREAVHPGEGGAVFQRVRQKQAVVIAVRLPAEAFLVGQEGPVEPHDALHHLPVIFGEVGGSQVHVGDGHGLDVLQRGDPVLDAEEVRGEGETQRRHHHAHHNGALQAPLEDPQALLQEHGGRVPAQKAGDGHADGHEGGVGVAAPLEGGAEELVEQVAQGQGAQQGQAPPEHRAQAPESRHVPGALAGAAAVEQIPQSQQGQTRQEVEEQRPEAHQVARLGRAPRWDVLQGDVLIDAEDGGEEVEDALTAPREPQEELGREGDHQRLQQGGQEVHQQVQHRQCEDIARQHGAEGGQTKEGHRHEHHRQNGEAGRREVEKPEDQGDEARQGPHHRVGDQHHGQPREDGGHKEAGPVYGQGVHEPHGPWVVQIAPHQHGTEDGVGAGDGGHGHRGHRVEQFGELQAGDAGAAAVEELQKNVQGHQAPHRTYDAPQGPEAGQVFPEEGPVKE